MLSDDLGAFMELDESFKKLEGFSRFEFDPEAESYIRKYFSAQNKSVDVTGAKPVVAYKFDRMKNNVVHDFFAEISDLGLKGEDVCKEFVFVDLSEEADGKYRAFKQNFAVVSGTRRIDGGFLEYSGKLIARGSGKKGHFVLSESLNCGEFIPERSGILCE